MMGGVEGWVLDIGLEFDYWRDSDSDVIQGIQVFAFEKCNFWTVEERGQGRCRRKCSIGENEQKWKMSRKVGRKGV